MKKSVSILAGCVLMILAWACNDIETTYPEVVSTTLPGRFEELKFFMDTTQDNRFKADDFCKDWEFVSTQLEKWVDGKLVETVDKDNWLPYRSLSFESNGSMVAEGMKGQWHYAYNFLMIDVSNSGGSIYCYEVAELTGNKMVIREEDYMIGGPIVTFYMNPSGEHHFARFTYRKK